MADAFNLTAQLNLRGPNNIKTVIADIRRQLSTVNASLNFKVDPSASNNIAKLNGTLRTFNATLGQTQSSANTAAQAISNLGRAVNSVNVRNLPQQVNASTSAITRMTSTAAVTTRTVQQTATAVEELGKQSYLAVKRFAAFSIPTAAVFALTNAVSKGVSAFIEYDKQFIKLQQVTGESAGGLQNLAKTITSLATGLGVASSDITTVASTLAQAGLSARDTEKALKALALSSLAPSFDSMNETVEGSIALMRQFGISASDLEKSLGSVNAVAAKFAVEASDIITAIQRTGGVFATASRGVSEGTDALNEFIAVFTSVRATTRESAETIATGLRTIFTRIQRGSTIEALKEFGVNLTDAEEKFVGAYKAVELLSKGLSKIDPRDLKFSQIVEELGGFRQIGKVIPLIQQFATAQDALKVAQKGQGSLAADAAKAQESLANKITKVKEEFFALFREIGSSQGFQTVIRGALDLSSALIKVADSIKGILPALTIFAAFKGVSALTQFGAGFVGAARARKSEGGPIYRFQQGGVVPGTGKGDKVRALLEPGEVVINNTAANTYGRSNLMKMNKYAKGGPVPLRTLEKNEGSIQYGYNNRVQPLDKISASINRKQFAFNENSNRPINWKNVARKIGIKYRSGEKYFQAQGNAFEEAVLEMLGSGAVRTSNLKGYGSDYPIDILNNGKLAEVKFTKKIHSDRTYLSKLARHYIAQRTLSKFPFTAKTDPDINIGSIDVYEMEQNAKAQFQSWYNKKWLKNKKNLGGTIQNFAGGGKTLGARSKFKELSQEEIFKLSSPELISYGKALARDIFTTRGAGMAVASEFIEVPQKNIIPELDKDLVTYRGKKGFWREKIAPFGRPVDRLSKQTDKPNREKALASQVSRYSDEVAAREQRWTSIRNGSPIDQYLLSKLQDPILSDYRTVRGGGTLEKAFHSTRLRQAVNKALEQYDDFDYSPRNIDKLVSGMAAKKFAIGGLVQKFVDGATVQPAGSVSQLILDRIKALGGPGKVKELASKEVLDAVRASGAGTSGQLLDSRSLRANPNSAKFTPYLEKVLSAAEAAKRGKESKKRDQLNKNMRAAAGGAYQFGLVSIFGPNGELGYSGLSDARELTGKNGEQFLTQIVRKSLSNKYAKAIKATQKDAAGLPRRTAARLQQSRIFGTKGGLAFDFDETLVRNADIPGKNPIEYNDLIKVQAALQDAKLTLLGKALARRLAKKPKLLDRIRILTARPQSNAPLLAGTLARLQLPIPINKITGVSGGLNKVSNISQLETLIDDNEENVNSVLSAGKKAILYQDPRRVDMTDASSAKGMSVIEGYTLEDAVKSMGVRITPDQAANPNRPIDYPSGLGGLASYWGIKSSIPTDTKRTNDSSALSRLWKEAQRYIVQNFATGGSVLAKLTPGELVIDPDLASSIGTGTLNKLNHAEKYVNKASGGGISVVPGTGEGDTYGPVPLPVGAYVIRKKAAKALGFNSGGEVRYFARGGSNKPVDFSDRFTDKISNRFADTIISKSTISNLKLFTSDIDKLAQSLRPADSLTRILEKNIGSLGSNFRAAAKESNVTIQSLRRAIQLDIARAKATNASSAQIEKLNQAMKALDNVASATSNKLSGMKQGKISAFVGGISNRFDDFNSSRTGRVVGAPFRFVSGIGGSMAGQAGFMSSMAVGMLAGQGENIFGKENGKRTNTGLVGLTGANNAFTAAGMESGATTLSAGLATASSLAMIPVVGPFAAGLTLAVTAVKAWTNAVEAGKKASEEFANQQREQKILDLQDQLDQAFKDYQTSPNNNNNFLNIANIASQSSSQINTDTSTEVMNKQRELFDSRWWFALSPKMSDKDIDAIVKENTKKAEPVAGVSKQLLEAKVASGTKISDLRSLPGFDSLAQSIASADSEYQKAVATTALQTKLAEQNNKALSESEKKTLAQAEASAKVAAVDKFLNSEQLKAIQKNKEIADAFDQVNRAGRKLAMSFDKLVRDFNQNLNKAIYNLEAFDRTVSLTIDAFEGNAKVGLVSDRDINVLQNPNAYSPAERDAAQTRAASYFGNDAEAVKGMLKIDATDFSTKLTESLNKALENNANLSFDEAFSRAKTALGDQLKDAPENVRSQLFNELEVTRKKIEDGKLVTDQEKVNALNDILSKELGQSALEAARNVKEMAIKILEFKNGALNDYIKSVNAAEAANRRAEKYRTQSEKTLQQGGDALRSALGYGSPSSAELRARQNDRIAQMTGGVTDPASIRQNIQRDIALQRDKQDQLNQISNDPSRKGEIQKLTSDISVLSTKIIKGQEALDDLANSGETASAALENIKNIQQDMNGQRDFMDRLATATPEEAEKLGNSLQRLYNNINGKFNRPQDSFEARKAFNTTFRETGNFNAASRAGYAVLAQQRAEVLSAFKDLAPIIRQQLRSELDVNGQPKYNEAQIQDRLNQMEANARTGVYTEAGLLSSNNPQLRALANQTIQETRNPLTNPSIAREAAIYNAEIQKQAAAQFEQGTLEFDKATFIMTKAVERFDQAVNEFTGKLTDQQEPNAAGTSAETQNQPVPQAAPQQSGQRFATPVAAQSTSGRQPSSTSQGSTASGSSGASNARTTPSPNTGGLYPASTNNAAQTSAMPAAVSDTTGRTARRQAFEENKRVRREEFLQRNPRYREKPQVTEEQKAENRQNVEDRAAVRRVMEYGDMGGTYRGEPLTEDQAKQMRAAQQQNIQFALEDSRKRARFKRGKQLAETFGWSMSNSNDITGTVYGRYGSNITPSTTDWMARMGPEGYQPGEEPNWSEYPGVTLEDKQALDDYQQGVASELFRQERELRQKQFEEKLKADEAARKHIWTKPDNKALGGLIYANQGTLVNFEPRGTDTVPAMLTPGEFVVNARATAEHLPLLKAINDGQTFSSSGFMNNGGIVYLAGGGGINNKDLPFMVRLSPESVQKQWKKNNDPEFIRNAIYIEGRGFLSNTERSTDELSKLIRGYRQQPTQQQTDDLRKNVLEFKRDKMLTYDSMSTRKNGRMNRYRSMPIFGFSNGGVVYLADGGQPPKPKTRADIEREMQNDQASIQAIDQQEASRQAEYVSSGQQANDQAELERRKQEAESARQQSWFMGELVGRTQEEGVQSAAESWARSNSGRGGEHGDKHWDNMDSDERQAAVERYKPAFQQISNNYETRRSEYIRAKGKDDEATGLWSSDSFATEHGINFYHQERERTKKRFEETQAATIAQEEKIKTATNMPQQQADQRNEIQSRVWSNQSIINDLDLVSGEEPRGMMAHFDTRISDRTERLALIEMGLDPDRMSSQEKDRYKWMGLDFRSKEEAARNPKNWSPEEQRVIDARNKVRATARQQVKDEATKRLQEQGIVISQSDTQPLYTPTTLPVPAVVTVPETSPRNEAQTQAAVQQTAQIESPTTLQEAEKQPRTVLTLAQYYAQKDQIIAERLRKDNEAQQKTNPLTNKPYVDAAEEAQVQARLSGDRETKVTSGYQKLTDEDGQPRWKHTNKKVVFDTSKGIDSGWVFPQGWDDAKKQKYILDLQAAQNKQPEKLSPEELRRQGEAWSANRKQNAADARAAIASPAPDRVVAGKDKKSEAWIDSSNLGYRALGYIGGLGEAAGRGVRGAAGVVAGGSVALVGGAMMVGGSLYTSSEEKRAADTEAKLVALQNKRIAEGQLDQADVDYGKNREAAQATSMGSAVAQVGLRTMGAGQSDVAGLLNAVSAGTLQSGADYLFGEGTGSTIFGDYRGSSNMSVEATRNADELRRVGWNAGATVTDFANTTAAVSSELATIALGAGASSGSTAIGRTIGAIGRSADDIINAGASQIAKIPGVASVAGRAGNIIGRTASAVADTSLGRGVGRAVQGFRDFTDLMGMAISRSGRRALRETENLAESTSFGGWARNARKQADEFTTSGVQAKLDAARRPGGANYSSPAGTVGDPIFATGPSPDDLIDQQLARILREQDALGSSPTAAASPVSSSAMSPSSLNADDLTLGSPVVPDGKGGRKLGKMRRKRKASRTTVSEWRGLPEGSQLYRSSSRDRGPFRISQMDQTGAVSTPGAIKPRISASQVSEYQQLVDAGVSPSVARDMILDPSKVKAPDVKIRKKARVEKLARETGDIKQVQVDVARSELEASGRALRHRQMEGSQYSWPSKPAPIATEAPQVRAKAAQIGKHKDADKLFGLGMGAKTTEGFVEGQRAFFGPVVENAEELLTKMGGKTALSDDRVAQILAMSPDEAKAMDLSIRYWTARRADAGRLTIEDYRHYNNANGATAYWDMSRGMSAQTKSGKTVELQAGRSHWKDIEELYFDPGQTAHSKYTPTNYQRRELLAKIETESAATQIKPQNKSYGGLIYANNGALISAQNQGTDTVPAMLTPGEFVVNRDMAQRHMPILNAINSGYYDHGGIIQYLNNGGVVAPKYYAYGGMSSRPSGSGFGPGIDMSGLSKLADELKTLKNTFGSLDNIKNLGNDLKSAVSTMGGHVEQFGQHAAGLPTQISLMGQHTIQQHITGAPQSSMELMKEAVQEGKVNSQKISENAIAKVDRYNEGGLLGGNSQIMKG